MVLTIRMVQYSSAWPSMAQGFSCLDTSRWHNSPCPSNSHQDDRSGEHPAHPEDVMATSPWPLESTAGPGTEQEEQRRRGRRGRQVWFEMRKREDACWAFRWHNLSTWRAKMSGCYPGLKSPLTQGTGLRKLLKTIVKSSNSRASAPWNWRHIIN